MIWTPELATYLEDAPWPATKDELIDYAVRSGAPIEVVENLRELEDRDEPYEGIEEIGPITRVTMIFSMKMKVNIKFPVHPAQPSWILGFNWAFLYL